MLPPTLCRNGVLKKAFELFVLCEAFGNSLLVVVLQVCGVCVLEKKMRRNTCVGGVQTKVDLRAIM